MAVPAFPDDVPRRDRERHGEDQRRRHAEKQDGRIARERRNPLEMVQDVEQARQRIVRERPLHELARGDARHGGVRQERQRNRQLPRERARHRHADEQQQILHACAQVARLHDARRRDRQKRPDGRLHQHDRADDEARKGDADTRSPRRADVRQHEKGADQGVVAGGPFVGDDHRNEGDRRAEGEGGDRAMAPGEMAEHGQPCAQVDGEERQAPRPGGQPEEQVRGVAQPMRAGRVSVGERLGTRQRHEMPPQELLLPARKVVALVCRVVAIFPRGRYAGV